MPLLSRLSEVRAPARAGKAGALTCLPMRIYECQIIETRIFYRDALIFRASQLQLQQHCLSAARGILILIFLIFESLSAVLGSVIADSVADASLSTLDLWSSEPRRYVHVACNDRQPPAPSLSTLPRPSASEEPRSCPALAVAVWAPISALANEPADTVASGSGRALAPPPP